MVKFALPRAMTSLVQRLPFVRRNRSGSHMRAHQRHPCVLVAELQIPEKNYKLDGMVIEVSRGGIRFREASTYILDRRGTHAVVLLGGGEFPGTIVNVDTSGYGIKLDALIPDDEVARLVGAGQPMRAGQMDQAAEEASEPAAAHAEMAAAEAPASSPVVEAGSSPATPQP